MLASVGVGSIGFAPSISVSVDRNRIVIANADSLIESRFEAVFPISIEDYHAHYSRYREVTGLGPLAKQNVLLLFEGQGQSIVLSLDERSAQSLAPYVDTSQSESIAA